MSKNEMVAKIEALNEWEALMEEARAEAEAIRDSIKAEMDDREELIAGEYKITYKTVSSSRFDSKGLKAELPELAERFTLKTSYRRFVVA